MIYNLSQYLKTKFPSITIYTNSRIYESSESFVPDQCILILDTGGIEKTNYRYSQNTTQIITRAIDMPKARNMAIEIFEELHGRFGIVLPQITVDSIVYAELQTSQISAIQRPYSLGADESGRYEFVTNYNIIYINNGGY